MQKRKQVVVVVKCVCCDMVGQLRCSSRRFAAAPEPMNADMPKISIRRQLDRASSKALCDTRLRYVAQDGRLAKCRKMGKLTAS